MTGRPTRAAVAALVLLAALPAPAAAAGGPGNVPLTSYDTLEQIQVEGTTYTIYEYDSSLPYVGGITIYRAGKPVRSEETVTKVLTAYARSVAVAGLKDEELAIVREFRRQSRQIQQAVPPVVDRLNATTDYAKGLKNRRVDNRTAWAAAVEAAPTLEDQFATGALGRKSDVAELRTSLIAWRRAASALERNATAVIETVQRRRNGTEIDKTELYRNYTAMLRSLEQVQSRAQELEGRLAEAATNVETIARKAADVEEVGDEIKRRFSALATELERLSGTAASTRNALTGHRETLRSVDQRAASIRERLRPRWTSPGAIRSKVLGSFGEGVLVVAAAALAMVGMVRE